MRYLVAVALLAAAPAFAGSDPTVAVIGPKAWACKTKGDFDASIDYLSHKERALFEKMLFSKNAPCMALPEGQKVFVRSTSMFNGSVIRLPGSESLLYTNAGALK